MLILQDSELWDIVNITTTNPVTVPTYATTKVVFHKKDIKAKRIIFDAIKDHVIPHISAKDNAHQMWTALTNLYRCSNENRKMVLREKLKSIQMNKGENMTTYLTRITQVRDVLGLLILPCPIWSLYINQESCLNRESFQSIFSHYHNWVHLA